MFNRYTITLGKGSDSYQFKYELESHRPAQEWAKIMQTVSVDTLRPSLNPWHGLTRSPTEKIKRLNELIDLLNSWLPITDKIAGYWDDNDRQGSLNRLHIHFPEHEKNQPDPVKLSQLSEYNDIIHGIEDIIRITSTKEYIWLLLVPNKDSEINLNDDDYKHFHPNRFFGELCLHYSHVGRHPLELLKARDFSCPLDQILPQRLITSYHSLRFYDDFSAYQYRYWLSQFYPKSTLQHLYSIDDPKLAFGYITLGKLVAVNDNILSKEEILSIVKTSNKILGWAVS